MHIPARIATSLGLLGTALAAQIPLVDPSLETTSPGTPLPAYVLAHAPLSYLHSNEAWWPSDVARHLRHVEPKRKHQSVAPSVTCANISSLDRHIFLSSKDDPFASPQAAWIGGEGPPDEEGRAEGPATIVAYASVTIGDHIGDWEHSMVRFVNGTPEALYLSQHRSGIAYDFAAVPAVVGRPLTYIALGTHATFASPGKHQHDFPGLLDLTDEGFLWDVTKNYRGYWYDLQEKAFVAAGGTTSAEEDEMTRDVRWLDFQGRWGDKEYEWFKKGQYCVRIPRVASACKLVDGPTGPTGKNLARTTVCQNEAHCVIRDSI
ncbi:hypothetical protein EIP86_006802 [Pleurotus ostreatoroseus]|nr:hypothetical protein EIP86_006802 [Pleurotus ostreatoroseus]